ncbi:hypothetical protein ZIOFF_062875 [Zingiber officinale]|uniref:Uncharacterized protein n=1 Tax=Zingiber officinale TaxID=94328 RepID=A0A8J5KFE2_ZINOF|nr:hypothetical protein ZIOFF_062875 [Zingiber officinale]
MGHLSMGCDPRTIGSFMPRVGGDHEDTKLRGCGAETGIECVGITVVPRTMTNDEQERGGRFLYGRRRAAHVYSWEDCVKDVRSRNWSNGIRAKTARVMALHSAHVIIRVRNLKVVDAVKQHILQNTPSAKINIIELKLSSQKSVRALSDKFLTMNLPLNILM